MSVLLLTGCIYIVPAGTANLPGLPSPFLNQQPVAYIDSVHPGVVTRGSQVTFSGRGIDTDGSIVGYEWRSSLDGIMSNAASFTSSLLSVGTHNLYFRVLDDRQQWSIDVNSVLTVNPVAAKPAIESFIAFPGSIVRGSLSELRWNISVVPTSIDNGIGQVAATGTRLVYPPVNTVYTLTASNEGSTITGTAVITVVESVSTSNPVIRFTANHLGGTAWQLNWNVSYATMVIIEPDIGQVNPNGMLW